MKNDISLAKITPDFKTKVDNNDLINLVSVRLEEDLRDRKKSLQKRQKELSKQIKDIKKSILEKINNPTNVKVTKTVEKLKDVAALLKPLVDNDNGSTKGVDAGVNKYHKIPLIMNGLKEELSKEIVYSFDMPYFRYSTIKLVTIKMPTAVKQQYSEYSNKRKQLSVVANSICELNNELNDIQFKTRQVQAKLTMQMLNELDNGKTVLKQLNL